MIDPDLPAILDPFELALGVGLLSEAAVESALPRLAETCPWYLGFRRATRAEDEIAKFDFAIYTSDVGRILLQVKSSRCGANKHDRHQRYGRPLYRVHAVTVRPDMEPERVLGRVLAACIRAREEAIAGRCVADHVKLCRLVLTEAA